MAELWTKQCVILRDFEGLLKYDMISMASMLVITAYDHKRYETRHTDLKLV